MENVVDPPGRPQANLAPPETPRTRRGSGFGQAAARALRDLPGLSAWRAFRNLCLFTCLAAIAHLLTVLLIPRYATLDAASLYVTTGAEGRADLIENGTEVIDADPLTAIAVCGFDLADGPLRVNAVAGQLPLAISLHVRGGGVSYAMTDRTAQRGVIEFVVLDQAQLEERIARDEDNAAQRELRIVSPSQQGIVVARALAKQPSDRPQAEAMVKAMACGAAG